MFLNKPFQLAENVTDYVTRSRFILGNYDLRIYLNKQAFVDIDRGSFDGFFRLHYVSAQRSVGLLGTIGSFCEFSPTAKIFAGGTHNNHLPVNMMMLGIPVFQSAILINKINSLLEKDHEPFRIGNAVLMSDNAIALPGSNIGDSTTLAAGAIASGNVEEFSIYGGVPAKKIKSRLDDVSIDKLRIVKWWNFETAYLGNNLQKLQEVSMNDNLNHSYRKKQPRLILLFIKDTRDNLRFEIQGFVSENVEKPFSDLPVNIKKYFSQINTSERIYWIPDVWNLSG